LNVATIWPFELRKFEPVISIPSPADPVVGLMEEMTGAPPGVEGNVVLVVAPPAVAGWCAEWAVPVWPGGDTVEGGGATL